MSQSFPFPTEEELRANYRRGYSILPKESYVRFYEVHNSLEKFQSENPVIHLVLDTNLKEVIFDGMKTVKFPSSAHLTYEVMLGVSTLGKNLLYSVNLLSDQTFVQIMRQYNWMFHDVYIHNPDLLNLNQTGFKKMCKAPKFKRFDPRFKARSTDVQKEFKERMEVYIAGIGYGAGFTLCIVTCMIGVPLLVFSTLALACDSSITGIRYLTLKRREKQLNKNR